MKPLLLSVGLALIGLSVPTWKFGARFLIQFFVSPFQFFIAPLWLLAYYAVRRCHADEERPQPPPRRGSV
jgi:hypothetical protein